MTCDAWTSIATESYVTVTAHFITDEWQLASHVLQKRAVNESHTGANIAELLKNVAEEWQITKKDLVLVTDNASNMAFAAELCKFLHVKCYAKPGLSAVRFCVYLFFSLCLPTARGES